MLPQLDHLEHGLHASPLTPIDDPILKRYGLELWIKRDDLLHPVISGNKWRKLKYILNHALSLQSHTLISMGGAHSNHLHALAYAGQALNLRTVGLIRGEVPQPLTPTLQDAQAWGMTLKFIPRSTYRLLRNHKNWHELPDLQTGEYWLPEGGAQALALQGVAEAVEEIGLPYDYLCVPCGTGTTLAGLIQAAPEHRQILGFAALKNAGFLYHDVATLLSKPHTNWQINLDYHFGGFAKTSPALLDFIARFQKQTGIPLEPVYTGKMLYGLYDLIQKHAFAPGQRLIALHTGGLQGNRGFLCTEH